MDFKILDTFQPVLWGLDGGSALEGSIDGSAEFLKVIFASNYPSLPGHILPRLSSSFSEFVSDSFFLLQQI